MSTGEENSFVNQLVFSGNGGVTCLEFIHGIRKLVHEQGKQRDDEWITDLVSTRLVGDALSWHISLEPEVQTNWKQLQKAMLSKYRSGPPKSSIEEKMANLTPSPAKAPSPATVPGGAASHAVRRSPNLPVRLGKIQVILRPQPGANRPNVTNWKGSYLSRNLDAEGGRITATKNNKEVLYVRIANDPNQYTTPCNIYLVNANCRYKCLGITPMSEADSDRDFVLTAVDPDHEPNAPRLHTSWAFSTGGEAKTEIWLTPTSDEITALPFRHLFIEWSFCMNLSSGNIYLTRSMKEFVTGAADEFCKVSFKLVDPD